MTVSVPCWRSLSSAHLASGAAAGPAGWRAAGRPGGGLVAGGVAGLVPLGGGEAAAQAGCLVAGAVEADGLRRGRRRAFRRRCP
jgi:hypothetical protein